MLETTERKYGSGWFRKTVIESLPHNLPVSASHLQLKLRVPLDFAQLSRSGAPAGGGMGTIFAASPSAGSGTTSQTWPVSMGSMVPEWTIASSTFRGSVETLMYAKFL